MGQPTGVNETTAAFHELLDLIKRADATFLKGDRAVPDELSVLEGYQWLTTILGVALDCYVWADSARPELVELTSPTRRWGGDNSDAYYRYAAIDPAGTYRIAGVKGDAEYIAITVYGGPDDGRWSTRIVGTANNLTMPMKRDGSFELVIGPHVEPGPSTLRLEPDAVALVTRDYLIEPRTGTQTTWSIERVDAPDAPPRLTDTDLAVRMRRARSFLVDLMAIFPLATDAGSNVVEEPYGVPEVTYGWAAGDAAYAMGSYSLADGEALVIEGRSPRCVFWNLCLWNPFLQTYDYRYEDVTINGGQCAYEADGSWRIVVAATDPGVPNWLSTAGHTQGRLWFRWFLPESTPERPTTRVVLVAAL